MNVPLSQTEEAYALLYCLHTSLGGLTFGELLLERLSASDWAGVTRQGRLHRVIGLLFSRFRGGPRTPPAYVMRTWQEIYESQKAEMGRKHAQLVRVLRALHDGGVPAILLKGAALAHTVYEDMGVRPMSDYDLLVDRGDLGKAEGILQELGYAPREEYLYLREHFATSFYHIIPYYEGGHKTTVELHWNLLPAPHLDLDVSSLWGRVQEVSVGGVPALVLAPHDCLFHLCVHASVAHKFKVRLLHVWDLWAVASRYGEKLDWECLVNFATRHGLGRCVGLPLLLAKEMLWAAVPDDVVQQVGCHAADRCLAATLQDFVLRSPASDVFAALGLRRLEPSPWQKILRWLKGLSRGRE